MYASAPTECLRIGFRRGRRPRRPASVTRGAVRRRGEGTPPYNSNFCRAGPVCPAGAGRNPPVTASPCQPPLGKGAEGTGVTDCHSQCAHWLRNDSFFTGGAVQARAGRPGGRPLRMRCKGRGRAGRCRERIERCQWQMKRDERVTAVKILSVRRKVAQKFWAPQQDHRPLRRSRKFCRQRAGHLFSVCTQILLCACYNERMCFYSFP